MLVDYISSGVTQQIVGAGGETKTKELGFEDAVVVFLEPRREARPHNDRP